MLRPWLSLFKALNITNNYINLAGSDLDSLLNFTYV